MILKAKNEKIVTLILTNNKNINKIERNINSFKITAILIIKKKHEIFLPLYF